MTYTASINDGYIDFIGTNGGNVEISEERFNEIKETIKTMPTAPTGFSYKLTAESLDWELVELPPVVEDNDATEQDYINSLNALGVDTNEEN